MRGSTFPSSPSIAPEQGIRRPIVCRRVGDDAERALHFAVRNEVFVTEQGLFSPTDRDARDESPSTIHVLGLYEERPAGAVRLYPLDASGVWKGDRLAVLQPFRRHGMGAPLVRFAVRTAGELGGTIMVAKIQAGNVSFFERLGWTRVGEPRPYLGDLHQDMVIPLGS